MAYQTPHRRQGWNAVRRTFTRDEIWEHLHLLHADKGLRSLAVSADDALSAIFIFAQMQPPFSSSPSRIFCKADLVSNENHDPAREYRFFEQTLAEIRSNF